MKEALAKAGGIREEALLYGAYILRNGLPEAIPVLTGTNRFQPGQISSDFLDSSTPSPQNSLRLSEMDFLSRVYFARAYRNQSQVSVDLTAALSPDAPDILLQDGDRIIVPRDKKTVLVFGQVNQPGFVDWEPGMNASFYIKRAGGAGLFAASAYVVRAGTRAYLPAEGQIIRSGELIFLNRRKDVGDTAELERLLLARQQAEVDRERLRADRRFRTTQAILQVLGTTVSIMALIIAIRQK